MTDWDVAGLAATVANLITGAALLIAVLTGITTRAWRPTIPVFLDLLLAAGLLRLGAADTWEAIATAGAIVMIRTLVRTAAPGAPPFRLLEKRQGTRRGSV